MPSACPFIFYIGFNTGQSKTWFNSPPVHFTKRINEPLLIIINPSGDYPVRPFAEDDRQPTDSMIHHHLPVECSAWPVGHEGERSRKSFHYGVERTRERKLDYYVIRMEQVKLKSTFYVIVSLPENKCSRWGNSKVKLSKAEERFKTVLSLWWSDITTLHFITNW